MIYQPEREWIFNQRGARFSAPSVVSSPRIPPPALLPELSLPDQNITRAPPAGLRVSSALSGRSRKRSTACGYLLIAPP